MQALSDSPVIAHRRQLARSVRLASRHQGERESLHSPRFNLREITKHLILLEDHLTHRLKVCPDCIRKHLMTIEALAEEAASLDQLGLFTTATEGIAELARQWMERLADGEEIGAVAQETRALRKRLVPVTYDPRGATARIASVHLARGPCPHETPAR